MRTLKGRTIALLEARQRDDLAAMVARLGGTVISAPSVRERPTGQDAGPLLRRLIDGDFAIVIALTGAGVAALFAEAEARGLLNEVRAALSRLTIVCRGPKPQAALKRQDLTGRIVTTKPHTTAELVEALRNIALERVPVMLLHYGERNTGLTAALAARGAHLEDVCLYEWTLPDDVAPMREVVAASIAGDVDAVLFTSQIQFRFLLDVARESGVAADLVAALSENIVVGAIGPVCAAALRAEGVVADVMPASPNSASLVGAVADYFELMA